jgi:hypothetical protein
MKKILLGLLVALPLVVAVTASMAAMPGQPQTLQGTIASIEGDVLMISQEAAAPAQRLQQVEIKVTPETVFEAAGSLAELKQGDKVEIQFKEEKTGGKVAVQIAKLPAADEAQPSEEMSIQ